MRGPLAGVRVIELCKTIAGPYTGSLLGDMGADVVKVEVPPAGDDFRFAAPVIDGESYYFMLANRNKRSLTLNLKDERAREIFLKLAKDADVIVENFRPGTVKRLGVDYETIKKTNPSIVYCSISGFGQDGPYRDRAAYDLILQAMGGIMSITGPAGGDPTPVGIPVVDIMTALFAAYGILSCLIEKEKTGRGQYIDISLFDSSVAPLMQLAGVYFATGKSPGLGQKESVIVPYGLYRAKDGPMVIEVGNSATWKRFCKVASLEDMANDPRFETPSRRVQHKDMVIKRVREVLLKKTVREWLEIFNSNGVPAGPVNDLAHVFSDPQVLHRKMLVEVKHPKLGPIKLIGLPVKLPHSSTSIAIPPPLVGQHTKEVLSELGYDDTAIEQFKTEGVI